MIRKNKMKARTKPLTFHKCIWFWDRSNRKKERRKKIEEWWEFPINYTHEKQKRQTSLGGKLYLFAKICNQSICSFRRLIVIKIPKQKKIGLKIQGWLSIFPIFHSVSIYIDCWNRYSTHKLVLLKYFLMPNKKLPLYW